MSNANVSAAASGAPFNNPVARQMHVGYVDAVAGQPFPPHYDAMTEAEQRNYEIGRMMVALLRGRGVEPEWLWSEGSGAMFRRLLGDVDGRACVKELSAYAQRDTTANAYGYVPTLTRTGVSFLQRSLERRT